MKNNKSLKVLSTAAIAAALVAPTVAVQPAFAASTYSVTGTQNVSQDSKIPGTTRVSVEVPAGTLNGTKTLHMRLPGDAYAKVNGVDNASGPKVFDKTSNAADPGEAQVTEIALSGTQKPGNTTLNLTVNGKAVAVNLDGNETNLDAVATKIANAINTADTGFTAAAGVEKVTLTATKKEANIDNLVVEGANDTGITIASKDTTKGKAPTDATTGSEFVPERVGSEPNQIKSIKVSSQSSENRYFTIEVTPDTNASANKGVFYLDLSDVYVPSGISGAFNASFESSDNAFTTAEVKLAQVGSGNVTTSVEGTIALTPGSNDDKPVKTIRVKEDAAGAFDGEYKLELPDGFEWYGTPKTSVFWGDENAKLVFDRFESKDTAIFHVERSGNNNKTTKATQFGIDGLKVKVDDSDAVKGDVKVAIKGSVSRSNDSIIIGTYGNFEGDVKAGDAKTVYAGQAGEELASLTIKEDAPGTLHAKRIIKLKLSGNAKWATKRSGDKIVLREQPQIKNADSEKNGLQIGEWELSGSDRTVIQATIDKESTNKPAKIVLEKLKVDVAPTAGTGDISVAVEGSAGITKDASVLGKTKAPVEISFDGELAKIDAGLQQQSIPNITIKEAAAEVIGEKDLVIKFPEGVKPTLPGKVEVTDGTLKLDSARVSVEENRIIIPVSKDSTKASTIKLSDIKVTSYRYVPEGDLKVKVTGPAVVENIKDGQDNDYPFNKPNDTHVAEGTVAKVVTPADKNKYAENIIFKIGSKTYTQDGKEMTMDVAPEVHPVYNRTYIPAAHFAASLNIPADKVVWNEASKTVTIFAGDKVVSATAGKKELVVNGTPVQIDAPVNYGQHTGYRVMVPYTHLALALGATVEWKADTQEIFVNKR